MPNSCPPSNPSATPPPSPARQHFLQRLAALSIKPTTHEYYVRWAEAWNKALGHRSAERTQAFFDALGRSTHLADWQFLGGVGVPPAVFGILPNTLLRMPSQRYILAHEILTIPWTSTYDWQGLADHAWALEPDHRTLGREAIHVRAVLPSGCGVPPQTVPGASRAGLSSQLSQDSSGPLPARRSPPHRPRTSETASLSRPAWPPAPRSPSWSRSDRMMVAVGFNPRFSRVP